MLFPDTARTYETFLRIGEPDAGPQEFWRGYLQVLRTTVRPLIRELQTAGIIEWFGFLLHDRGSGVPTHSDDRSSYVHLRMSLAESAAEEDLLSRLPGSYRMTRKMVFPDPPALDGVELPTLLDGNVRQGWKLLGESSEWVLSLLEAHAPEREIPFRNVHQFVHYLENQLMLSMTPLRRPWEGRDEPIAPPRGAYEEFLRTIRALNHGAPHPRLSAVFRRALDTLNASLETRRAIRERVDLWIALDVFDRLYYAGEDAMPHLIAEYLVERHGWRKKDARKVAYTWEVFADLRNKARLRDTFRQRDPGTRPPSPTVKRRIRAARMQCRWVEAGHPRRCSSHRPALAHVPRVVFGTRSDRLPRYRQ